MAKYELISNQVARNMILQPQLSNEQVGAIIRNICDPGTYTIDPSDAMATLVASTIRKDIENIELWRSKQANKQANYRANVKKSQSIVKNGSAKHNVTKCHQMSPNVSDTNGDTKECHALSPNVTSSPLLSSPLLSSSANNNNNLPIPNPIPKAKQEIGLGEGKGQVKVKVKGEGKEGCCGNDSICEKLVPMKRKLKSLLELLDPKVSPKTVMRFVTASKMIGFDSTCYYIEMFTKEIAEKNMHFKKPIGVLIKRIQKAIDDKAIFPGQEKEKAWEAIETIGDIKWLLATDKAI